MATSEKTRALAERLLAYEINAAKSSEPLESAILRVYERLRKCLGEVAGVSGFQSLATRALALAKTEAPSLSAARIAVDGSLQGLGDFEQSIDFEKVQAAESPTFEAGRILIARLLGLLLLFLGEALTLRLLRSAWPSEAIDEFSSENGRKA